MDKVIASQIIKLSSYTNDRAEIIKKDSIPVLYHMGLERKFKPDMDYYRRGYIRNALVFVANNLPIYSSHLNTTHLDTMDNLVSNKVIQPFLFFYKGRFIKWSDILIKITKRYTYIGINNVDVRQHTPLDEIQTILLPSSGVKYRESLDLNYINSAAFTTDELPIFMFNNNGELIDDVNSIVANERYTIVTKLESNKGFEVEQFIANGGAKYKSDIIPDGESIGSFNVVYFKNGLLLDNEIEKKEFEIHSHDTFKILGDGQYSVKVFFGNIRAPRCPVTGDVNVIDDIPNPNPSLYSELDKKFEFKFDRNKTKEENLKSILEYILTYNARLMNEAFRNKSNISIRRYSGSHIKSLIDDKSKIRMSTRADYENYNKVIILRNGRLFDAYYTIKYEGNHFIMDVRRSTIADDDVFEILYFKKSYNTEVPLQLKSDSDDIYYIGENVDLKHFSLYSTNLFKDHKYFNTEISDKAQYSIPYDYKLLDHENVYEIVPDHPFYYDKDLTLVSNRQFRYQHKKIKSDSLNFELSSDFKFCTDIDKYLVFVNGNRLSRDNFKITIVKHTRPFYSHSLYSNIPFSAGDTVDVFYVPDKLREVYTARANDSGVLNVELGKIDYSLDPNLYLVFVNGKKLLPEDLQMVSKNVIKIKNANSNSNVVIIKHIEGIDEITRIFRYNNDIISKYLSQFTEDELNEKIHELFGNSNINNIENPYNHDEISMKKVIYKIIRDYYDKPYITDGNEFIYDFDTDGLEFDDEGNIIVPSMDANYE